MRLWGGNMMIGLGGRCGARTGGRFLSGGRSCGRF